MMKIEITPEAFNDLEGIREYLDDEFGKKKEKEILKGILNDLKRLGRYPDTDTKLFERFGIETDYKCLYTHENYAFFRIENDKIKIIRILSTKRDFMYILFGIKMTSDDSDDYWDEE